MLSGAILAGGQNRRMHGRMKALLSFHGESLIERQLRMMQKICAEIIVVTNTPEALIPIVSNVARIVTDLIPNRGPLSGLHAVFTHASYEDVWVVGCDMPFICAKAGSQLHQVIKKSNCDAAIPVINSKHHPLHGVYRKQCIDAVETVLRGEDYRMMNFLDRISWTAVQESFFINQGIDTKFVVNVNTPEQYRDAKRDR